EPSAFHHAALSPDGKLLATREIESGQSTLHVALWDMSTRQQLRTFAGHDGVTRAPVFMPDSRHVLVCGPKDAISVWDCTTGECIRQFGSHEGKTTMGLALSCDAKTVASCPWDSPDIYLWDFATGKELRHFKVPSEAAHDVCFSPAYRLLLT